MVSRNQQCLSGDELATRSRNNNNNNNIVQFKVTPDLRGCPPVSSGKNSYARHFKGKHGKLYIVRKLNKWRFQKKYELPVFLISQKKIAKMTAKMTMRHSGNELIGYQNSAAFCEIWPKSSLGVVKQKCVGDF